MKKRRVLIDYKTVGQKIKDAADEKHLYARDVCEYVGVQPSAYYKWLRGEMLPNLEHLFALSELLGISVDELLLSGRGEK